MKRVTPLVSALSLTLVAITAFGQSLHVYDSGKEKELLSAGQVKKITFTATEMKVETLEGAMKTAPLAEVDFFSFRPKAFTALAVIEENFPTMYYDNEADQLVVRGEAACSSIELFTIQGVRLESFDAEADTAFSLSSYPAGIYLAKLRQGEKESICKIIKR